MLHSNLSPLFQWSYSLVSQSQFRREESLPKDKILFVFKYSSICNSSYPLCRTFEWRPLNQRNVIDVVQVALQDCRTDVRGSANTYHLVLMHVGDA